jgi:hypothetical protein
MRLSYSSMAPIILNLIQWMDCSCSLSYTLPSYLGLLEVLVYKVFDWFTNIDSGSMVFFANILIHDDNYAYTVLVQPAGLC